MKKTILKILLIALIATECIAQSHTTSVVKRKGSNKHYTKTANTIGYWTLDGNSNDSTGNGNNGANTNIAYSNGKVGFSASFGGTNSMIACASKLSTGTGNFTLSAWINPAVVNTLQAIVSQIDNTNTAGDFLLIINSSAAIALMRRTGTGNAIKYLVTGTTILASAWYNIIAVYDGTLHVYINGVLDGASQTDDSYGAVAASNFHIGMAEGTTVYPFNGLIDEAIIENVAWNQAKVTAYYNLSK